MSRTGVVTRNRTPLLLAALVLLLLVLVSWLRSGDAEFAGALDPRNPKDAGARAVAEVLVDRGVDVQIARGQDAFLDRPVTAGTTVLVSNADALGRSTLSRLREHARGAGAVVLVGPSEAVLSAFGLEPARIEGGELGASCPDPLMRGLTVKVPPAFAYAGRGCFGTATASLLRRVPSDAKLWLLGAPAVLSNDRVLDADNAAVALRLLGQHPTLVWYVADTADTTATDSVSISSLLPPWLYPGLALVALSTLAFLAWRSRRLGPLVREPLPVVIRASESTESRGRLYRRTRDRGHAALMLRAATRRRLAGQLALAPDVPVPLLAGAVARATGRPQGEVDALLGSPVRTDAALAQLGRQLIQLETEVRQR